MDPTSIPFLAITMIIVGLVIIAEESTIPIYSPTHQSHLVAPLSLAQEHLPAFSLDLSIWLLVVRRDLGTYPPMGLHFLGRMIRQLLAPLRHPHQILSLIANLMKDHPRRLNTTEKGEAPPAFRWDICGCSSRKDSQRCGDSDPKGPDPVVMTKSGWCTGLVVHRRTRQILLNK
ncbi:hypothetical protein YC2023_048950 [Brassica napus]